MHFNPSLLICGGHAGPALWLDLRRSRARNAAHDATGTLQKGVTSWQRASGFHPVTEETVDRF
ncbi:hypothetical protein [Ideonella sp. BN130291]|uniref:hypothetical protein n=1 Tax=Ideonella sp. BN130291 TaxID=3112940 RepID=UPI002E26A3F7|nr:hypothetical protein [Ideonella sp. BN130291]